MIDKLLFASWDEAPPEMGFELRFGDILDAVDRNAGILRQALRDNIGKTPENPEIWHCALRYYCIVPSIINIALNYKICLEHGLPLHPTVYFEVDPASEQNPGYERRSREYAHTLYLEAIALARAAIRLDPALSIYLARFAGRLPPGLSDFLYSGSRDKYTWRASEPEKIHALAQRIKAKGPVQVLVGAAHGSIMPGLLLAEYVACRLYYVRFSMFKRHDLEPILAVSDRAYLSSFRGRVVLFDEDVAQGTTLSVFSQSLRLLAPQAETAAIIRHAASSIKPDFVGNTWWD
jgi:hypothetical protein